MLYDAGSFGSSQFGLRSVSSVMRSEGIEHLDAVVISHADIDHFNALPELCRRFSIGVVYLSPQMIEDNALSVRALMNELQSQSITVRPIHSGKSLMVTECSEIVCLGPPFFGTSGSDNSNSVVLLVSAFGRKVLLPGDLEDEGMDFLLDQSKLDCDVVMAPHHGSLGSRPREFMEWSSPEWIVISSSRARVDPRSIAIYQSRGSSVLSTASLGAIRIRIDSGGIKGTQLN
jgi:competence protein ComEC